MGEADFIDKIALIYVKERRILMALSRGKDTYYIPGGKRENGESDEQALCREIKEELTVDICSETVRYYGKFCAQAHGKPPGAMVRMTCYTAILEGQIKPGSEIENTVYYGYSQRDIVGPVDQLIFDDLRLNDIID